MTVLPPNIRIFAFFLVISLTDKPVDQSIHAYALTQLSVFRWEGLSFMIFTENKERVRAIPATKYKKICGAKIYSRTRTFGAKVHKWNIRVKRWQNKYEIIN